MRQKLNSIFMFVIGATFWFSTASYAIVGGQSSTKESAVAIVYDFNGHEEIRCSGTLVHPRAVLTARHCVYRRKLIDFVNPNDWTELLPRNIKIYTGRGVNGERSCDLNQVPSSNNQKDLLGNVISVEKIEYREEPAPDVAILILSTPVKNIKPALLPVPGLEIEKLQSPTLLAVGFGNNSRGCPVTYGHKLEYKPILDLEHAETDGSFNVVSGNSDNIGTRDKDSGSPLLLQVGNEDTVIGVLRGPNQFTNLDGGNYTKVIPVTEWIQSILKDLDK